MRRSAYNDGSTRSFTEPTDNDGAGPASSSGITELPSWMCCSGRAVEPIIRLIQPTRADVPGSASSIAICAVEMAAVGHRQAGAVHGP